MMRTPAVLWFALLLPALPRALAVEADPVNIRDETVHRCQRDQRFLGAYFVKRCIDQDLRAYRRLIAYPPAAREVIDRCLDQSERDGWHVVELCVERELPPASAGEPAR